MTMLCVTHEMGFARQVANRVIFMDQGQIVEQNSPHEFFDNPQHAYTRALMQAVPVADPHRRKSEKDLNFKPIPSPIHPVGYEPEPNAYEEVAPGHFVLTSDSGY